MRPRVRRRAPDPRSVRASTRATPVQMRADACRHARSGESPRCDSRDSRAIGPFEAPLRRFATKFFSQADVRIRLHVARALRSARAVWIRRPAGLCRALADCRKALVKSAFLRDRTSRRADRELSLNACRDACAIRARKRNIWCRHRSDLAASRENAGFFVKL